MDGEERTAEAQQIVGMKLERARKQRGLSLAGAEQTTKIHSRHIEALERGDFDALPSPGWARNLLTLVYLQGADLQNEVARAGRQQDFLYEMFRQALDPRNVLSDPSTLNVVLEYSETNMSIVEVVQLAGLAKAAENSDVPVSRGTIAGREETLYSKQKNAQITYWVPDDEKLSAVVKETVK